jgi:hypothetical protein
MVFLQAMFFYTQIHGVFRKKLFGDSQICLERHDVPHRFICTSFNFQPTNSIIFCFLLHKKLSVTNIMYQNYNFMKSKGFASS